MEEETQADPTQAGVSLDGATAAPPEPATGPAEGWDWAAYNRLVLGVRDEARVAATLRGVPLLGGAELKEIVDRRLGHERARLDPDQIGARPWAPRPPPDDATVWPAAVGPEAATDKGADGVAAGGNPESGPDNDPAPSTTAAEPAGWSATTTTYGGGFMRADLRSDDLSGPADALGQAGVQRAAWSESPPPPLPPPTASSHGSPKPPPMPPLDLAPRSDPAPRSGSTLDRFFRGILNKQAAINDPYATPDGGPTSGSSWTGKALHLFDLPRKRQTGDEDISSRIPFRNDPDAVLQPTSTDPAAMDQRDVAITTYRIARELGASKAKALWLVATANKEAGLRLDGHNRNHFGLFQFDHDMWNHLGGGPDIFDQKAQIKAMLKRYDEIERRLKSKKLPVSEQSIYVVHQKGDTGGPNLLGAAPDISAVAAIQGNKAGQAGSFASVYSNLPNNLRESAAVITAGQLRDQLQQSWSDKRDEAMQIMRSPRPNRKRNAPSRVQPSPSGQAPAGQSQV